MTERKRNKKARRKRFIVEATLGPLETEVVNGMFTPGVWYLIDEGGGWVLSEKRVDDAEVLLAADDREIDRIAGNIMDVWEETRPGHRWAFHVSTVVRERNTGELRRKP